MLRYHDARIPGIVSGHARDRSVGDPPPNHRHLGLTRAQDDVLGLYEANLRPPVALVNILGQRLRERVHLDAARASGRTADAL